MHILVIGGTRFFGIHTVKQLLVNGHNVTIATRGSHGNPFGTKVSHILMDRTNEESVRTALSDRKFDAVIDKVAYASNDVRSLLKYLHCRRYIQMSSCAVYPEAHLRISEKDFDPASHPLHWMDRPDDYAEGKRQAERATLEFMDSNDCTFVRFPVVMGEQDYTERLQFYAEHICQEKPMFVDKPDVAASYIHEREAGDFLAHLIDHPVSGAVNGCSRGGISQGRIISYLEQKTGKRALLSDRGDPAPYNGFQTDVSYCCEKAEGTGYIFSRIESWIFGLLDQLM